MLGKTHDPGSLEDPTSSRNGGTTPGKPLPKAYEPGTVEDRIYRMWEETGAFKADNKSKKEPFTISMPPPNATGQLHLGHAVMLALEDIFIRFARMRGKEALWVPGTDHAAIATESVVIRKVQKEEKVADPRAHFGRDVMLQKIAEFVESSQNTIRSQVRKMGSSCDWSREGYTMEPSLNRCVNEVFVKMHKDGLIYRAERVVNWDTALQTTISDDEIEYEDVEGMLYTFEYVSAEQTGGDPIYVSTSRPETKLGDTALAVHPDDKRYKKLVGRHFPVKWPGGIEIHVTVIADHTVDPEFGSGVLGVTPFHSKIDFEMWQRHKNEMISAPKQVIGEDGFMTEEAGSFAGLSVAQCREKFIEGLREQGRMKTETKYVQPLSVSYRSKKAVEPLPKLQWFIDVNKKVKTWQGKWKGKTVSLKDVMQDVVKSEMIKIIPDRFEKTYFHWIDNLKDWCISRQIWWGHRVPVWYCISCSELFAKHMNPNNPNEKLESAQEQVQRGIRSGKIVHHVSAQRLDVCPDCGSMLIEQDSDTLDTWFSSALWTWSTLVDKKKALDMNLSLEQLLAQSPDYQKFHPTHVMETGYDILFFWVARMILMTTYATGHIPFKTVYLHGLIRSRDGRKMSKSHPETMIDPLDIIPKYGADALRLSMIVGQSAGNDSKLYEEKIAGYRNFINKLWNASRFVLMKCEEEKIDPASITELPPLETLSLADRALLHALDYELTRDVTDGIEKYRLSDVGERLYAFVWDFYCDWYLELSKGEANVAVLVHALRKILKLLHPYCPFVTEELWAHCKPKDAGMLIAQEWPEMKPKREDTEASTHFQRVIDVITAIRSLRADQGIDPALQATVTIITKKQTGLLESQQEHIRRMARVESLTIHNDSKAAKPANAAVAVLPDIEIYLHLSGLIDVEKEKEKLTKEKANLEVFVKAINGKLGNAKFVESAPAAVVETEREKLATAEEKLKKIEARLKGL